MACRGSCKCSIQVFGGRYRSPAVEHTASVGEGQNPRLEIAFGMFDLPTGAALQELQVTPVGIERKPASLAACLRDLLVGITNVLEVQLPMFVSLIGKMLRLASDSVNLAPRGADFVDDSLVPVAP